MKHYLSGCLSSMSFNLKASILKQFIDDDDLDATEGLDYEIIQDPVTGEIIRNWFGSDPDDTQTIVKPTNCYIEGFSRSDSYRAKTQERYQYDQRIIMFFPPRTNIGIRDKVTDIRDSNDYILYQEDARGLDGKRLATIFKVISVQKNTDVFGRESEVVVTLERAEVQNA